MTAVRRTVELGRAARAQAKVKVRQPLRRAVVVATDAEREAISARASLVTAELNVKEVDFVSDTSELVSYSVKPNYRSLGPRFGKQMPQAAAAIEALDATRVAAALDGGGEIGVNLDGHDHTLGPEDVSLVLQPLEGYQVEAEAGHAVALSLELDDDLLREGWAREVVRAVQEARKQAGLDVTDRIDLALGGDEGLLDAVRQHEDYLAGEVLASEISFGDGDGDGSAAHIDGRELRISLSRAAV
jgi:isoleucyl-tRNA synthetase